MNEITIQIDTNLATILKNFEALPQRLQNALSAGLRLGLEAVRGGIQRRITTTFNSTSAGGLRQSIEVKVQPGALEGSVSADKNYAAIQEYGTVGKGGKFPDIVPVRAKALRFELQTATRIAPLNGPYRRLANPQAINKVIFSQRVSIPARPFFFPGVQDTLKQVPKLMDQQLNAALEGGKS